MYALRRAMLKNDVDKFRELLAEHGWPDDSKWSDYQLLVKALKEDRAAIAHVILDNNARVWKCQIPAAGPLHIAVSKSTTSSPELIEKILRNGAKITAKDKKCDTALHVAFNNEAPSETIDLILRSINQKILDVGNRDGLKILHIACTRPNLNLVKLLFDNNQKYHQVSCVCGKHYAGYTELHFAVDNGRYEIAKFLVEQGVTIYSQDCRGTTPLHLALRLRDVEMIDLLLAHDNLKEDVVNTFGVSHFMVACAGSKKDVVEKYLERSLPLIPTYVTVTAKVVNAEECTGYTALHFAVDLKQDNTVKLLLEKGADCCDAASDGLTSHTIAEKRGYKNIGRMLQKHCDIVKTYKAIRCQDADFATWGNDYERSILIDRVREIQLLRKTLKQLKIINASFEFNTEK